MLPTWRKKKENLFLSGTAWGRKKKKHIHSPPCVQRPLPEDRDTKKRPITVKKVNKKNRCKRTIGVPGGSQHLSEASGGERCEGAILKS